jgi:hypothetical protein
VSSHILSSQKKQTGFKDLKHLTKLGKEIRQFMVDMDNFEKVYVELLKAVNKHFNFEPPSTSLVCLDQVDGRENNQNKPYEIRTMPALMRNKFRANGWSNEEMTDYANCYSSVHMLLLDSTIVVNVMMSRYFEIVASNSLAVGNMKMARILNQILLKYIGTLLDTTSGSNVIKHFNNDRKNLPPADGRALRSRYQDGGIIFSGTWSVEPSAVPDSLK